MSFNYDETLATQRDQIRFFVGDTDPAGIDGTGVMLQDEEIDGLLTLFGSLRSAAVAAAKGIAARFSRLADQDTGDISVTYSQMAKAFLALADTIADELMALSPPIPYTGGILRSDKRTVEADTNRVRPSFTVDEDDNPFADGGRPLDPNLLP